MEVFRVFQVNLIYTLTDSQFIWHSSPFNSCIHLRFCNLPSIGLFQLNWSAENSYSAEIISRKSVGAFVQSEKKLCLLKLFSNAGIIFFVQVTLSLEIGCEIFCAGCFKHRLAFGRSRLLSFYYQKMQLIKC